VFQRFYPPRYLTANYPAPILFVCGSLDVLIEPKAVACVGSRKTKTPYAELEIEDRLAIGAPSAAAN
jgi:predicted Rossmann fold nucleotide-binding protein DprA/Smf involved in DNA uptake